MCVQCHSLLLRVNASLPIVTPEKNVPIYPTRTVGESAFPFVPAESYRRVCPAVLMLELSCTPKGSRYCQKELPPSQPFSKLASRLSVRRKRTPSLAAQRRESCKAHPRDDPAIKMTDYCVRSQRIQPCQKDFNALFPMFSPIFRFQAGCHPSFSSSAASSQLYSGHHSAV